MIIVEGVDKGGKSTLAAKLAKQYNLQIKNFGIPDGDPTLRYEKELKLVKEPMIYDRFFHGEIPYSIVKKRTRYIFGFELRMLELMLASIPHVVIHVRPSVKTLESRFRANPDPYIHIGEAYKILEEYDHVFEHSISTTYLWDGEFDPHPNLVTTIEKVISPAAWAYYDKWREIGWEGIGTLEPDFLFVGERYNEAAPHQVPFWSKSGKFLMKCLKEAHIDPRLCHFTNAVTGLDRTIPEKLIKSLSPKVIVCLGKVAWENTRLKAANLGIKAVQVPHPAYFERFHAVSALDYIAMLEQTCIA